MVVPDRESLRDDSLALPHPPVFHQVLILKMVKVLCFATLSEVLILKDLRCTKIVQDRVTAGFFPLHVGRQELNTHKKSDSLAAASLDRKQFYLQ
jgi:hypothetical protein